MTFEIHPAKSTHWLPVATPKHGNRQPHSHRNAVSVAYSGMTWHPVENQCTFVKFQSQTPSNREGVYGCGIGRLDLQIKRQARDVAQALGGYQHQNF
jgi:hypothetical protein